MSGARMMQGKTRRNGFSMIELLVAMALLAVLVVMLLGLVDSGTKLWKENENRVESYREARAALNTIGKDLANLVKTTNIMFFAVNEDAFPYVPEGAEKSTNRAGAIFFHSAILPSAQYSATAGGNRGEVCEVGYFLAYGKSSAVTNSPVSTMNLYRYTRASDATYTNIVTETPFSPKPTITGPETELLARNVTSFQIVTYGTNVSGLPSTFTQTTNDIYPRLVEIRITALNQDASKKLTDKSDWQSPSGAAETLVNQQEQVFFNRVRLNKP